MYTDFQLHRGLVYLTPMQFKGQLYAIVHSLLPKAEPRAVTLKVGMALSHKMEGGKKKKKKRWREERCRSLTGHTGPDISRNRPHT